MDEVTQSQVPAPVQEIVKKFPKFNFKSVLPYVVGSVLIVIAGVGVGYLVSPKGRVSGISSGGSSAKLGPQETGIADEKTFSTDAEGTLEEGGISGEGTHKLIRPGGVSQTVYLTSTVVDLNSFVGKKVHVWGQTLSARKAGWLMDVGKIKIVE